MLNGEYKIMNKKKKEFLIGYGISVFMLVLFPIIGVLTILLVTFVLKERHRK